VKRLAFILIALLNVPGYGARVFESANTEYFSLESSCPTRDESTGTWSAWFKTSSVDVPYHIVGEGRNGYFTHYQRVFVTDDNRAAFSHVPSASVTIKCDTTITTSEWFNVIVVCSGAGGTAIYVNNADPNTDATAVADQVPEDIAIGTNVATLGAGLMNGMIAYVGLWDSALDASARAALQTSTPDKVGTVLCYWPLDESGGGNAIDRQDSGDDYDLTEVGTISYSSDMPSGLISDVAAVLSGRRQQQCIVP
jgi:hypothetical protein